MGRGPTLDSRAWLALIPFISLIYIGIMVWAIADILLIDNSRVRGLPKGGWVLLVVVLPLIGSLLWVAIGRERSEAPNHGRYRDQPMGVTGDRSRRRMTTPPSCSGSSREREQAERIRELGAPSSPSATGTIRRRRPEPAGHRGRSAGAPADPGFAAYNHLMARVFVLLPFVVVRRDGVVDRRHRAHRPRRVRGLPKGGWIVLVILLPVVGAVLWFLLGRERLTAGRSLRRDGTGGSGRRPCVPEPAQPGQGTAAAHPRSRGASRRTRR